MLGLLQQDWRTLCPAEPRTVLPRGLSVRISVAGNIKRFVHSMNVGHTAHASQHICIAPACQHGDELQP